MTIPVLVTEERTVAEAPRRNTSGGVMGAGGQILVKLPPQMLRAANASRTIEVDVGLTQPNGPRVSLAKGMLDATGNWSAPLSAGGKQYVAQASQTNGAVRIVFANPPAAVPLRK